MERSVSLETWSIRRIDTVGEALAVGQKVLVEFKEFDPRDSCRSRLSSSRARVVTPRRSSQLLLHRVG